MIVFTARGLPTLSASSLAGTSTLLMRPPRSTRPSGTREELTIWMPPSFSRGWNLSKLGRFMTMRLMGRSMMGEPISSSESTTVQLAVPPRISTP